MATKKEINAAQKAGQITAKEATLLKSAVDRATQTGKGISASETARLNQALEQAKTTAIAKGGVTAKQLLGTVADRAPLLQPTGGGTGGGEKTLEEILAEQRAEQQRQERKSAYQLLIDEFTQLGIPTLADAVRGYMVEDLDPDLIPGRLLETEAYKQRFSGNQGRIAKGLGAYSPREYLQAEETYRNLLESSGLQELANQSTFGTLIGGAVSPVEVQDRIQNVFNKIDNADDTLKSQLGRYFSQYGIADPNVQRAQVASALLTGETSSLALERQLKKAQLRAGAAMARYDVAEPTIESLQQQLEAQGVSNVYGAAQAGFKSLAEVQPNVSKLAELYGGGPTPSLQTELEQEAFLGLKSQRRKKLEERELSEFSGQSGTSQVSLARSSTGQI
jgi:hypothetical protein